jgi:transportin-3
MLLCFEDTGYASFLWIVGKTAGKFGGNGNGLSETSMAVLAAGFRGVTEALGRSLGEKNVVEIPDGGSDILFFTTLKLTCI